nr:AhpA/YtjB family protein [Shewanella sp. 1CM18E]
MIAIALFIGLDQLWETSLLQGQQLLKSQTEKMARLLVQQTAYGAAPALQLENDEQLQWLAQALVLDPKVMSASIFSEDGVRLSFAQSVTEEDLEPGSEELNTILDQYPPYVEAVSQDGKNLGYVEVRLEPKYFFNEIKEAHQINMEQQQMMLLIAGLIGMLLSRALSFKRADFDRRKARVKLRRLLAKKKAKAEAKEAKKLATQGKTQTSATLIDEAKPNETISADNKVNDAVNSGDSVKANDNLNSTVNDVKASPEKMKTASKAEAASTVTSVNATVNAEPKAANKAQQGAISQLESEVQPKIEAEVKQTPKQEPKPAFEANAADTKSQPEPLAPKPKAKRAPKAKAAAKTTATKSTAGKTAAPKSTAAKVETPAVATKAKRATKVADIPESASAEADSESSASEKVKPASAKKASVRKTAVKKAPVKKPATKAKAKVKPIDNDSEAED